MQAKSGYYFAAMLVLLSLPARAQSDGGIKKWVEDIGPTIISNDPARYDEIMMQKKPFFTDKGYKSFKKAMEISNTRNRTMDVAKLCATDVRASGDTWQVDVAVVLQKKNASHTRRPSEEGGLLEDMRAMDSTLINAEPRARSFFYQQGTFVLEENKNGDLLVKQYIAQHGPEAGFENCRLRREIEEKLEDIQQREKNYQRTQARFDQDSANLEEQRQKLEQELSGQ